MLAQHVRANRVCVGANYSTQLLAMKKGKNRRTQVKLLWQKQEQSCLNH